MCIALLPGESGSDQLLHFQYQEVDGTQLGKYYIITLTLYGFDSMRNRHIHPT